jgi:hypothetical protein
MKNEADMYRSHLKKRNIIFILNVKNVSNFSVPIADHGVCDVLWQIEDRRDNIWESGDKTFEHNREDLEALPSMPCGKNRSVVRVPHSAPYICYSENGPGSGHAK